MKFARLRRLFRTPHLVKWYPARFRTTRHQALRELYRWIIDQFEPEGRAFDRKHCTSTSWFDLGNYEPTPPSVVRAALEAWGGDPRLTTFVDLGSGKGRVLLVAAERPFKGVLGIEYRYLLHRRAQKNIQRLEVNAPIHLEHGDVLEAPLPEGPVIYFLYNPFPIAVVDAFLHRLTGPATVILVNPLAHRTLLSHGFTVRAAVNGGVEDRTWALYERVGQ